MCVRLLYLAAMSPPRLGRVAAEWYDESRQPRALPVPVVLRSGSRQPEIGNRSDVRAQHDRRVAAPRRPASVAKWPRSKYIVPSISSFPHSNPDCVATLRIHARGMVCGRRPGRRRTLRHQSLLEYANYRYFKVATLVIALAIGVYVWDKPPGGPNGGTWWATASGASARC